MSGPAVPRTVLGPDQLFPVEPAAAYGSSVYAFEARDTTWVAMYDEFSSVGGRRHAVQETRATLGRIFPQSLDLRYGLEIGKKAISYQLHGQDLERGVRAAYRLEDAETDLNGLPDSFGVDTLDQRGVALRRALTMHRNQAYAERTAGINAGIQADPSDILFGIAIKGVPMAAKLEHVYIGAHEGRSTLLPVLSGKDGELGRLTRAEDTDAYGMFVEATPAGKKQAVALADGEQKEYERVRDALRPEDIPDGMIS